MITGLSSFAPCRRFALRGGAGLTAVVIAVAGVQARALDHAQDPFISAKGFESSAQTKKEKKHTAAPKDAIQPNFAIPVTPLGFAPPASFYLGDRVAQVSLNFLDEDNLLFTFRVPGLISREPATPGQLQRDERHIRALVLYLPAAKVTAEALWVLHDFNPYLWALRDGRFLLRDRNMLQIGDASLRLEPFLRFPGPVASIEFDPRQQLMAADTTEPAANESQQASADSSLADLMPSSAAASVVSGSQSDPGSESSHPEPQSLLRIFHFDTRKVMLFSRVNGKVRLPLDGEGYYSALRGNGSAWMITYEYFRGQTLPLGMVDSTCNPSLDAPSSGIVLASACTANGARHLTVFARNRDKDHNRLWEISTSPTRIWPLIASSPDGMRIARATLEVTHPVSPYAPLDSSDIRGQAIQVFDLATGKVQLTVPASPVLDGGGNFALSPSGKRFAVLNDGAIQVFDLPPAPHVEPASATTGAERKP